MANALTKIQTNALADDAVTGAKIADDTVAEANMANDAISLVELKAGTDGQIITYDASGNPTAVGPGTDGQVLTSTGAGSPPAFETLPTSGATINNATENELVTVASTTTQLDAESTLTFDGHHLTQTVDAGGEGFNQTASGAHYIENIMDANRSGATDGIGVWTGNWNGTSVAQIQFQTGADTTNKDDGQIAFYTAPSGSLALGMKIDRSGIVTKPTHPVFIARRSGTGWNHSSGTLAWDNQIFDQGNDYDDSNYTFTCPVDGVYVFIISVMQEHGGTSGNIWLKKNGSTFSTTQWLAAGGTSDWDQQDKVTVINCSADDAITSAHNSNANFHGGNYAHFSGYLIG